jgi:hypothetical protein
VILIGRFWVIAEARSLSIGPGLTLTDTTGNGDFVIELAPPKVS